MYFTLRLSVESTQEASDLMQSIAETIEPGERGGCVLNSRGERIGSWFFTDNPDRED